MFDPGSHSPEASLSSNITFHVMRGGKFSCFFG